MEGTSGKPLPPLPPPDQGEPQSDPTGVALPVSGSVDYWLEGIRLSTISEVTERSEYSKHYPSARQVAYRDSIISNTEYGAFLGMRCSLCN